jgi:hypothetical protein
LAPALSRAGITNETDFRKISGVVILGHTLATPTYYNNTQEYFPNYISPGWLTHLPRSMNPIDAGSAISLRESCPGLSWICRAGTG